jgi:ATP-dependent helicase HrpB
MAGLPLPPRIARLLLEGERLGVADEALGLAALLSERRAKTGSGDLLAEVDAALRDESASGSSLRRVRDQLRESLSRASGGVGGVAKRRRAAEGREEALPRTLLAAYPDRVARRRSASDERAVLVGGRGVRLAPEVARTHANREFFLAVDLDDRGADAWVRRVAPIERQWLEAQAIQESDEVRFDEDKRRIVAWRVTRYLDLVIEERQLPPPAPGTALAEAGEAALLREASQHLDEALGLGDPEFGQFLTRWGCLRTWMPELELPEVGEERFRALLATLVVGARSFAHLGADKARQQLVATLTHSQRTALQREAPERLSLPNGRTARLTYQEGKPPVLAARIQDLFGWSATPRVAAGRVPVLLQLLAPNGRPQQTTQDLASFWVNTYPQVRKELAGRYPKHAWPLDPTDAREVQGSRQPRPRKGG